MDGEEPDTDMAQDYNATLNLPKTAFPMRGNLPKREPDVLGKWEEQDLYEKMIQKNQSRPMYVLHARRMQTGKFILVQH